MNRLAILHPTAPSGQELREALEARPELWSSLRLLSASEDEIGTLTELRGAAAVVERVEPGCLDSVDLAFFCGSLSEQHSLLGTRPSSCSALVLSPDADPELGPSVVAGVNLERAEGAPLVLSPHPAVVLLAPLLASLDLLGLLGVTGTVVEPVSGLGRKALEQLFEETRDLLAFQPRSSDSLFPQQLAFNLVPSRTPAVLLEDPLPEILDLPELEVALQPLRGGIFHGISAQILVKLREVPSLAEIRSLLSVRDGVELVEDPSTLGPIDSAAHDGALVAPLRTTTDGVWLWAILDNLAAGTAGNAVRIAERMLESGLVS